MKDAYYFSHDSNARMDPKCMTLIAKHGWEGYGFYWMLNECMYEDKNTALTHALVPGIAYQHRIDITLLSDVIKTCIDVELYVSENGVFWSDTLRRRKAIYEKAKEKKSAAGRKGMANRWNKDNNDITKNNAVITQDNKVKERKVNNNIINDIGGEPKKRKNFIAPTEAEVIDFFNQNPLFDSEKNIREANKFYLHYESNGWMVGKNKMKNWKSAASGWIARDTGPATIPQQKKDVHNSFSNKVTAI
jgi:hypothetical protein